VRFTDPVVALIVPAGVHPAEVELTRPGSPALDRPLPVGNRADTPDGPRLPWFGAKRDPDSSIFPVADAQAWPDARGDRRTQLYLALHRPVEAVPSDRWLAGSAGHDAWYAYGATPDGRRLVGTDLAALGDPSRAYAVLLDGGGRATVVDGGTVDRVSAVPFRVRLPDGQGWLVAAKGSELSWRVGSGAWTSAGRDAALLPAPATEVRAGAARVPLR
jgi:hypothetical protein